jgi:TolA-binding protein
MPSESEDFIEPVSDEIKLSRFDGRTFWRLAFWASSAAVALVVVAGTAVSDVGADRLKVALAPFIEPAKPSADQSVAIARTDELQRETRALAATVRELTSDRDRLKGRIATLEQNLDDITGAIKKQTADASRQTVREPLREPATPPPVLSAPPTTTASIAEPAAAPAPTAAAPPAIATTPVPLPPARTAAIPAAPEQADAPPVLRKELGVDLGGTTNLEALRAQWAAIKANLGPELVGMHASYLQRVKQSGAVEYRLIVGAFANTAAALRLCSKITAMQMSCRAGLYSVQQFAER